MRISDIDAELASLIAETASVGATASGNIATVPGGFWRGRTKGRYPYIYADRPKRRKKRRKR